jgi:hypothetical protein
LEQSLKTLEEKEDWIIIEDDIFMGQTRTSPTVLSEEDYIVLMKQFNFISNYQFFVNHYISIYLERLKDADDNLIISFSLSTHFVKILTKCLDLIPKTYLQLISQIAVSIVVSSTEFHKALNVLNDRATTVFAIQQGSIHKTTVEAQMDSHIFHIFISLIKRPGYGIWKYLKNIPLNAMSSRGLCKLIKTIVEGSFSKDDTDEPNEYMTRILVSAGTESQEIFPTLIDALLSHPNIDVFNIAEPGTSLIDAVFNLCFANAHLKLVIQDSVVASIVRLTGKYPFLISTFLKKTREFFPIVESFICPIFKMLDLSIWLPDMNDFLIMENLLKDPVNSVKCSLGQIIIDGVNFEKTVNLTN